MGPDDAKPYLQVFVDDPDLARMVGFDAPAERAMRATFRGDAQDREAGEQARFAAVVDGAYAGLFQLHGFSWENRRADVGFIVVPAQRRRGIAAEALRLISDWGLRTLGLQRLGMHTIAANVAAQRLAERAGYEREGVLRAYARERDEPVDFVVYSVLG